MKKTKINYSDLSYEEKLACMSLFPNEAKKDEDRDIRLEAYKTFGFTEEAKKDKDWFIRLEAYKTLGFTEKAKKDENRDIRLEASRAKKEEQKQQQKAD